MSDCKKKINEELQEVHDKMSTKYKIAQEGIKDEKIAQEMENILRYLKMKGVTSEGSGAKKARLDLKIDETLKEECDRLYSDALAGLQSNGFSINELFFGHGHQSTQKEATSFGVDDIVEAEIAAFLAALEKRGNLSKEMNKNNIIELSNIDILNKTSGRIKGNLPDFFSNMEGLLNEQLGEKIVNNINNYSGKKKELIDLYAKLTSSKKVQSKSIKADVISNIEIIGTPSKELNRIIRLFKGRSFTIKNYNSGAKSNEQGAIHLGETLPYKSILAELLALDYNNEEAKHIFFHSLESYRNSAKASIEKHIPHLRFAYELEGNGLVDESNQKISGADFLIVNDPYKYQIYVRSTKKIISDLLDKKMGLSVKDPFTSEISIYYSYLNENYKEQYNE